MSSVQTLNDPTLLEHIHSFLQDCGGQAAIARTLCTSSLLWRPNADAVARNKESFLALRLAGLNRIKDDLEYLHTTRQQGLHELQERVRRAERDVDSLALQIACVTRVRNERRSELLQRRDRRHEYEEYEMDDYILSEDDRDFAPPRADTTFEDLIRIAAMEEE
jgi:hypothetical protein